MSESIFISYRRSDAGGHAGRLHDRLTQWFDADELFFDAEHINPGDPFPQRLADGIDNAKVVLALIGPDWLSEINRRAALADTDFVRVEVERALQRRAGPGGPKVIPVLLGLVAPPSAAELHESLRAGITPLLSLDVHTFQGKNADWNHQFVRLRELLATVPGVPAPRYRAPVGAVQPFRVIEQSLSPYFSDPNRTLAALQRALEASGAAAVVSPVAIYGMGGVGKTQLALKYSLEFRDRYAGVWWFRAETDTTLQLDALDCCRLVGAAVGEGEPPSLALKRWLGQTGAGAAPWLLVFDNAEDLATLRPNLPERGGHHVLITSRNPAWSGIARPVTTAVWTPEQGADFLARRLPGHVSSHDHAVLRELADALGGLPLALEQAAGFLDETGMAAADYTVQVRGHDSAPLVLDEGRAATGYERSVLATLSIAFPRLGEDAAQLLRLLAFCAPDPVPERLFREQPEHLPAALAETARHTLRWEKAVAALRRYGLAERTQIDALDRAPGQPNERKEPAMQLHRLTQEVARHRMVADPQADAGVLLTLLRNALPKDAGMPLNWPRYASLVPHVRQLDRLSAHVAVDRRRLAYVLDRCGTYFQHGPALYIDAVNSFERALRLDREDLGEDHPNTLISLNNLAATLWLQGNLAGARALQEQGIAVSQRLLGDEHPDTLTAMNNLANTLQDQSDLAGARSLQDQVLSVRRRVLGQDHPDTLISMNNLADTLHAQGDLAGARALQDQVFAARRRVMGDEHPDTLISMNNLAGTLQSQGDLAGARALQEQVLAVRRRVLGEEHPDTLNSMNNLAIMQWHCNERSEALALMGQTVDTSMARLGADHPATRARMNTLAQMRAAVDDSPDPAIPTP